MAKVINISDDAGATQSPLPGSEGSFSSEAESIDDTILGQTFQSNEVGLTGWSVSANGLYKGFPGYVAEISKFGTPTGFTTQAMTLVSGKTYQIDDATREVWSRTVAITVFDNAVAVVAANILNIDHLFGRVTFVASYTPTTPITVTGSYFARSVIGRANTYNLTMTAEAIDETDFQTAQANSGTRVFVPGLRQVALELSGIFAPSDSAKASLAARDEILVEIDPAGDGLSVARGFFKYATVAQSGAVGALEEETINLQLTVPLTGVYNLSTTVAVETPFNWQFESATVLPLAIRKAITSWVEEDNTVEVQYLPNGAIGQSPLDGVEGRVVFTDISLQGGLSNMNVFTMEMQGTDVFTVV